MMRDANVVAASPSSVYRVLCQVGVLSPFPRKRKTTQDGNLDEAIRIMARIKAVSEMGMVIPNTEDKLAAAEKKIRDLEGQVAAFEAKSKRIDRKSKNALVGTWQWFNGNNHIVAETGKISVDGKIIGTAQQNEDTPGTFLFLGNGGNGNVDTLSLSKEGNLLEWYSSNGGRVWAVKLK